jgi:hypothetical protein
VSESSRIEAAFPVAVAGSQKGQTEAMHTKTNKKRLRGRALAIVLGGGVLVGISVASAADLGGLRGGGLGADATVVASCDDNGIDVSYSTGYNPTSMSYTLNAVNLANIGDTNPATPTCVGLNLQLTLSDAGGAGVRTITVPVTGATASIPVTPGFDVDSLDTVAILIS